MLNGYDWPSAELDLRADPWGACCPDCAVARSQVKYQGDTAYCTAHRCAARVRSGHHAGERCRHHVEGGNPLYCDKHGCSWGWAEGGTYVAGCANEGSMRDLPDGRRATVCGQHYKLMN